MATNVPGITIMKNESDGEILYVVLLENESRRFFTPGSISAIHTQISSKHVYPESPANILFLMLTDSPYRDRSFAETGGINIWFVDSEKKELVVAENQIDDFFGLRYGLEQTINAEKKSGNPWNLKEAVKDKSNFPYVTIGLIAINVIWFIVLSFMGDTTSASFMWSMGADYGPSVFEEYQFYRLLLSMFMHFGFPHLVGNMVYLAVAGTRVEKSIGHLRFFLIYMLAGIAASFFSTAYYYLTGQATVSAGASGAIYGIIGIIIYLTGKNRGRIGIKAMGIRIMVVLIFLFYSNFVTPNVDIFAHLFGLIFGIVLSFAFLHTKKPPKQAGS